MNDDRRLRVAVIGAGAFAEAAHLPGLRSDPDVDVVAIVARDAARSRERARALADRFAVPEVTTDLDALLARDDLDAVTICTPNAAHHDAACAAFAAGKHVFCEKPLGLDVAEASAMRDAAFASGRVHLVAFTYRYLHGVAELRRRVAAGDVGEPFLLRVHHEFWDGLRPEAPIGWRERHAAAGGGVLFDSGSHFYDLARFVLGPITAVRGNVLRLARTRIDGASGEARAVDTDDLANAWFRFASGAEGSWHASRITPASRDNAVQVIGTEGALSAALSRGRIDTLQTVRAGEREWRDLPLPDEARAGGSHALLRMLRAFADACRRGAAGELDATFVDGLAVQRLLDATEQSLDLGWVAVDAGA